MNKTNQLIEEVLRLDKEALHGPWYIDDSYDMVTRALNNYHDPIVLRLDSGMYGTAKDPHIQLIMHYRSSAPKLAAMLAVAVEGLECIQNTERDIPKAIREICMGIIAEIERKADE